MLSVAMFEDMNRSEQESLYRTSRTLSLVPPAPKVRHHSHGNIQPINSSGGIRIFGDRNTSYSDDLVLSVLKSPVNHVTDKEDEQCGPSPASEDELMANAPEDDAKFKPTGSEDELTENEPSERVPFLQRLRGHRTPRFGEAHHKRVPTPLKRKQRFSRNKSHDIITPDDVVDEEVGDEPTEDAPRGIPDPYYPIYLPIDQAFKAKYVFHHKKGKTFQERLYVFLEHPGGWICFVYHFTVKITTGQKINNVIDGLPNNVSHLSSKSEVCEDSKTVPLNSNKQEFSERNEPDTEKAPQVPVYNLPSKSGFHDTEDKDTQLTLLNKSPSSLPSIPLKAVPALGAIPKILQNLPSTSKSSPKKLKNESYSISDSYSYLYYKPNQKTKSKSYSQDSPSKSTPVHNSSSSSIDSSSLLPRTPEPFLIPPDIIKDAKNSLLELNHFLTQLKGERDYSVPEINTHIEIAAIDENVKLNKLASRKFFSLNPRNVGIKDESLCKNLSQESLIAFYDLDTNDSDEDEDNN